MLYFNHEAVVSITTMQILTNHRPRSHITTTATNDSALWFSITARFPNTVVISYNIGVISSTNDATSGHTFVTFFNEEQWLFLYLVVVPCIPVYLIVLSLETREGDGWWVVWRGALAKLIFFRYCKDKQCHH